MRALLVVLLVLATLLAWLQYRLWFGVGGTEQVEELRGRVQKALDLLATYTPSDLDGLEDRQGGSSQWASSEIIVREKHRTNALHTIMSINECLEQK